MHRKVLFAVKLYDDLSGRVLKGPQYSFYLDGMKEECIRKTDGYYVFLDKGCYRFQLEVKGQDYETYRQNIDISQLDKSMPDIKIRLIPKNGTGLADEKVIKGKLEEGQKELWLFPKTKKPLIKFGGISKSQSNEMKMNLISPISILNLNLGCIDQEKDEFDIFIPEQKLEHNIYQIDRPLNRKYPMGFEIVRVYHAISKEDGSYHFYLDDFYETDSFVLVYKEDDQLKKIELHL